MKTGTVQRALELAESGSYLTVTQIIHRLEKEGEALVRDHLEGLAIRRQLKNIIAANKRFPIKIAIEEPLKNER